MAYVINKSCQYGCQKKPQDLSNQASNCKLMYNLILNFKIIVQFCTPLLVSLFTGNLGVVWAVCLCLCLVCRKPACTIAASAWHLASDVIVKLHPSL